jgi:hypothetical protein
MSDSRIEEERGRDRWTVICWHDDCCLDTYGYGSTWPELAREHVRETGHEVSISLTRHDRFRLVEA